jgi:uncharacterized Ntn-hydrolase superfamily protein
VAYDPETERLGVAVQTHQPGVGWLVPWLTPGIGAIATQASVNPGFGPQGLSLLREGVTPERVVAALAASDEGANRRQLAVMDARGAVAAFTGSGCIAEAGHRTGAGYSVQANMMLRPTVVDAMFETFPAAGGDLAHRMLAALEAAQEEDGDIRGMQSAALVVIPGVDREAQGPARAQSWERVYDLRVDEHDRPLEELARLVRIRAAGIKDEEGHALLDSGDVDGALAVWRDVRAAVPDQEELAFWQAIALLESQAGGESWKARRATVAAEIFLEGIRDAAVGRWLDLADRLRDCGMIEKADTAVTLRHTVESQR